MWPSRRIQWEPARTIWFTATVIYIILAICSMARVAVIVKSMFGTITWQQTNGVKCRWGLISGLMRGQWLMMVADMFIWHRDITLQIVGRGRCIGLIR